MVSLEQVESLAKKMDEKHWLRLAILLAPGVVAWKISIVVDTAPAVRIGAVAILGIGLATYTLWDRIKAKLTEEVSEELDDAAPTEIVSSRTASDAAKYVAVMKRLVALCDNNEKVALALIEDECVLEPEQSYLAAIERAYRRKEFQVKRQSGS